MPFPVFCVKLEPRRCALGLNRGDPLLSLRRFDKHYLGAGEGLVFAPPHPLWLDRPGFWDGLQLFVHRLEPGFTLTLLGETSREIPMRQTGREWTPAGIVAVFEGPGIHLTENRSLVPGGSVVSECTITNLRPTRAAITFVMWTCVESSRIVDRGSISADAGAIAFRTRLVHAHSPEQDHALFDLRLRMHPAPATLAIAETQLASTSGLRPDWDAAPFAYGDVSSLVSGRVRVAETPSHSRTLLYAGLFLPLTLESGEAFTASAALDVASAPPLHESDERARNVFDLRASASAESRTSWCAFFDSAPALACEDPWIERFFDYRWYGLRLNFLEPVGEFEHPTCAEGTDFFHDAVSYSAWCHTRELRWLPDPERARGTILTFLDRQRDDGWIPGILYPVGHHPTASYFADWGGSVLALHDVHPDAAFLETVYRPLQRYAEHLRATRDPDSAHLFRVLDPYETGQETMSRYTAVDAGADRHHFDYRLDLFGIDITIYAYRLYRALARIAARLGHGAEVRSHDAIADRIADAVRTHMWDPEAGLFFDVDPRSGRRTGIRAAVCFYPWMTDIPGDVHAAGFERNLFDPDTFWTPVPVPSTARSDSTFDADGFWKGVRQNCPWNGRVWPMTNCHIADALALQATTHSPHLRERAANFIQRFVRMMFHDGDPGRPNSYEHYSPIDGRPCLYRGIDDYQHSWINDLIIRWIAGFRPGHDGFMLDPLPSGIRSLVLERVPFRGRTVSITIDGDDVRATVDGAVHRSRPGQPLHVVMTA